MKYKLVNTEQIFVDATHVKACANSKKMRKRVAHERALWYEEELNKEIEKDRLAHGKKPLKKKDDNQPPASGGSGNDKDSISEELPEDVKTQKCSISDPESGWFRKGEHKHETACDKHGWILGYTVHPGNEHDSRTFKALYDKISKLNPQMVVADAGYKTPAIAHQLSEDGIQPLFPYTRPKTKEGFFGKHEFAYDEYYDCYICPGAHILTYSTTNRNGYKEYKSCGEHCAECQYLSKCTESKDMYRKQRSCKTDHTSCMGRIHGSSRRHSAHDRKQTDLPVKKRNHRADLRYSERTAWISIYAVCRKSTDGNESRAYLCMHEFEKTGKDSGKT